LRGGTIALNIADSSNFMDLLHLRNRSGELARALLASSTCLLGCGGPTAQGTDLGSPSDLSVPDGSVDLAIPSTDMAFHQRGQLGLIDVEGTRYLPGDGGEVAVPATHVLVPVASFPSSAGRQPDYEGLTFSIGAMNGCEVWRYDLNDPTARPVPDVNAGLATLSGWDAPHLFPTVAGTSTPPPMTADQIVCGYGAVVPDYGCAYVATMPDAGADGISVGDVFFPPVLQATYGSACPFCPPCSTLMIGGQPYCEQRPIAQGAMLSESVTGGMGYGPLGRLLAPANTLTLTTVTMNGAILAPTLDALDGVLDSASNLQLQWSCDGTNTPGAGCSLAGSYDVVRLELRTSDGPRSAFRDPPASGKYGVAVCYAQTNAYTVYIQAFPMSVLLSGRQPGGSVQVMLTRLKIALETPGGSELIVTSGGRGLYGYANLK
jgi:hypothetical protein